MSAPLSGELSAQPTEGFHSCFLIDEAPCIPLRLNSYFVFSLFSVQQSAFDASLPFLTRGAEQLLQKFLFISMSFPGQGFHAAVLTNRLMSERHFLPFGYRKPHKLKGPLQFSATAPWG